MWVFEGCLVVGLAHVHMPHLRAQAPCKTFFSSKPLADLDFLMRRTLVRSLSVRSSCVQCACRLVCCHLEFSAHWLARAILLWSWV